MAHFLTNFCWSSLLRSPDAQNRPSRWAFWAPGKLEKHHPFPVDMPLRDRAENSFRSSSLGCEGCQQTLPKWRMEAGSMLRYCMNGNAGRTVVRGIASSWLTECWFPCVTDVVYMHVQILFNRHFLIGRENLSLSRLQSQSVFRFQIFQNQQQHPFWGNFATGRCGNLHPQHDRWVRGWWGHFFFPCQLELA